MNWLQKRLLVAGGLALLYFNTGGNPSGKTTLQKYSIPEKSRLLKQVCPVILRQISWEILRA
jgi:hypothetical protein